MGFKKYLLKKYSKEELVELIEQDMWIQASNGEGGVAYDEYIDYLVSGEAPKDEIIENKLTLKIERPYFYKKYFNKGAKNEK